MKITLIVELYKFIYFLFYFIKQKSKLKLEIIHLINIYFKTWYDQAPSIYHTQQ